MTTVDLTTVVNALIGLVMAILVPAIPIAVTALLKRLGVANNADLSAKLTTAADAAAGAAYKYAMSHEGGLSRLDVHNAAIATGVTYVTANLPGVLATLGVTPAQVEQMVSARLGTLLAQDPTVTADAPAKTPAPAPAAVPPAPPPAAQAAPAPAPAAQP